MIVSGAQVPYGIPILAVPAVPAETSMRGPGRWIRRDLSRGLLDSEEHLVWRGRWPDPNARDRIPALITAAFARSIGRFSLGLIRCHASASGIDCRLRFGSNVLSLVHERTDVGDTHVVRRWRITPGLLVRPTQSPSTPEAAAALGALTLGVERRRGDELHAWMRVEAFPSRFLGPLPLRRSAPHQPLPRQPRGALLPRALAAVWEGIGWLYGAYHSHAAHSALASISRSIGALT